MRRGPDKQFDPDEALQKAMELFWAKGYAGTGMAELVRCMGIGKRSLYDTFGNKRELFRKAIEHYSMTVVRDLHRELKAEGSPLENVRQVLRWLERINATPGSLGCLLGVSMAQFRTDDAEIAEILRTHMLRVENAYYKAFAKAQADGDLKPATNVRNLARLFMSAHQGLALIGRVTETPAVTRGIVDGALAVLETA